MTSVPHQYRKKNSAEFFGKRRNKHNTPREATFISSSDPTAFLDVKTDGYSRRIPNYTAIIKLCSPTINIEVDLKTKMHYTTRKINSEMLK